MWGWSKSLLAKKVFKVCRWLHVYISTLLFGLLIFFCVTGILLNHLDWWNGSSGQGELVSPLPSQLALDLRDQKPQALARLTEFIALQTNLKTAKSIEWDREFHEITLDYPLPSGFAFITVLINEHEWSLAYQQGSVLGVLNDLHKGRHSGKVWSIVIDVSALLMLLFSFTGLFILLQSKKYRIQGLLLSFLGLVTPVMIYFFWVPSLSV